MLGLTPNQKDVLHFIHEFIEKNHYSPSFREIQAHFSFSSIASVHKHIQSLAKKGIIELKKGRARSISLTKKEEEIPSDIVELPIIGELIVGYPIELFSSIKAKISFPKKLIPSPGSSYALQVRGDRLIQEHVLNRDIVIVESKKDPSSGEVVLVSTKNGSSYLKRYFPDQEKTYLENIYPESADALEVFDEEDVSIQAVVLFILRDYKLI
ncbi:MAG: repressor LexA [Chlamydiales bacterium]|nr:repressor LexA [Chlamydiales bacterium]